MDPEPQPPQPDPDMPAGPQEDDDTPPTRPKKLKQLPQKGVDDFWKKFNTKYPGKVTTILPDNPYAKSKAAKTPSGVVEGQKAVKSYNEAAADCKRDVERIVRECRRINQKYRDPHFEIELDLKCGIRNCLNGLNRRSDNMNPKDVKRVSEIFEDPHFYMDKATSGDVRQGRDGDCWLMSALCALGTKDGLIDKVCVARDEQVGIYGFVFHRDGEWQQCIIDDKLYLAAPDYDEAVEERRIWNNIERKADEEEYIKAYQTGSRALYFASCSDENETWLPLLEKAYAKAHGDYYAIASGFVGEGIEDLTGGVTSEIFATDILDTNKFWEEQLSKVNDEYLFGCSTGHLRNWLDPGRGDPDVKGIIQKHAYSIIDAREVKGERLVKLRNPWGEVEWTGAWSDGSKEWNAEWMQLLKHEFGDDGVFWMSYKDMLRKYQHFDRTRLFDASWNITQMWTTVHVPWTADYLNTKFTLTLVKESPVVIVLSQLDTRYFQDLQGQYEFTLSFRVQRDSENDNNYIVRSHGNLGMKRSCNTDITLEAGSYSVLLKVSASRDLDIPPPDAIVKEWAADKSDKLIQQGLSYDLAHAKGLIVESEEEKRKRLAREAKKTSGDRAKLRTKTEKELRKKHEIAKKQAARDRRAREKSERAQRRRAARENANGQGDDNRSDAAVAGSVKDDGQRQPVQTASDADAKTPAQPDAEDVPKPADDEVTNGPATVESATENGDKTTNSEQKPAPEPIVESLEPVVARADTIKDVPESIKVNGEVVISDQKQLPTPDVTPEPDRSGPPGVDDNSDVDSFPDFEFDSDIDLPPLSDEDEEDEKGADAEDDDEDEDNEEEEEEEDEGFIDPWNAVCVLGLRVYSQVKDADVTLQVIRPKNDEDKETSLDRDDPAKGLLKTESSGRAGWASSNRTFLNF